MNTYTMHVEATADGAKPKRFEMMGYDTLLGSHYDKYYIVYTAFDATVPDKAFDLPVSKCISVYIFVFRGKMLPLSDMSDKIQLIWLLCMVLLNYLRMHVMLPFRKGDYSYGQCRDVHSHILLLCKAYCTLPSTIHEYYK